VELLVVIAIIALLISILAPSLKVAQDITKQAICSTNLHSIGTGVIMYAEGSSGKLPGWTYPDTGKNILIMVSDYKLGVQSGYIPLSFVCTYRAPDSGSGNIRGTGVIDPGTGKPWPWGLSSVLLYFGQLASPNQLYCPAIVEGQLSRAAWPDPYGERYNTDHYGIHDVAIVKCSYPFNPHCENVSVWPRFTYTKLDDFPAEKVLATEPLYNTFWGASQHRTSGETSPTWNRLYVDTHVSSKASADAYKVIDQGNATDVWADFDKAMSYVEN